EATPELCDDDAAEADAFELLELFELELLPHPATITAARIASAAAPANNRFMGKLPCLGIEYGPTSVTDVADPSSFHPTTTYLQISRFRPGSYASSTSRRASRH